VEKDPFFNFISDLSDKIQISREHKQIMERVNSPESSADASETSLDRGRMRLSRNLNDTQIPPPLIYVGLSGINGSDMLTLYGNSPVSAHAGSLSAFNIELWCENGDYNLFPSTVTSMTSATYNSFLNHIQYRLHNGFSLANTSMVFPLCAFTLGAGQTVTRSIGGQLTKTYRKLCTATVAPTAACIIRNHSTAYSYLSDFEVLITDFSFNYVP